MPVLLTAANARYTGNAALSSQPFTIEGWFFFRASVSTQQYLVEISDANNGSVPGDTFQTFIQVASSKFQLWLPINSTTQATGSNRTASATLANGQWYYLVATCNHDGTVAGSKLYINGSEAAYDATSAVYATGVDMSGRISVGGRAFDTSRTIVDGLAHKIRIYKRVLSGAEIAARYANPTDVDYVTTYASDLVFRADYDSSTDSSTSSVTMGNGTAVLTSRPPLDMPGVAWFNDITNNGTADSAGIGNTLTTTASGGRISTMANFAATGADAAETGSAGAIRITTTSIKVGVTHAAHSSASARYNSAATGSGPTWDNRNITVFGWIAPVSARVSTAETILHLGDPATGSSAVLELSQTYSYLQISRAGGATEVGTSDVPMQTTLPRFFATRCTASDRTIMVDSIRKDLGSAFTSATSTGLRIGAPLGGTSNPFVGDLYRVCIAQRPLSNAELDALYEYGKSVYKYDDATKALVAEGSSTMWGTSDSSANNEGILSQLNDTRPNLYIINHANASENVSHFDNGYAAGVGASVAALKTAFGWTKSDFLGILQVYGNDFDSTGAVTLLDRYENGGFNYVSVYDKWVADIGTIIIMWPVVRTDYASDMLDESREEDVRSFFSLTASDYPQFSRLLRPSELEVTAAVAAELQAVSGGSYYIGDETHLAPSGMRLYKTGLRQTVTAFILSTNGTTFRDRNFRRMSVR